MQPIDHRAHQRSLSALLYEGLHEILRVHLEHLIDLVEDRVNIGIEFRGFLGGRRADRIKIVVLMLGVGVPIGAPGLSAILGAHTFTLTRLGAGCPSSGLLAAQQFQEGLCRRSSVQDGADVRPGTSSRLESGHALEGLVAWNVEDHRVPGGCRNGI